jgi:hypothetical protein
MSTAVPRSGSVPPSSTGTDIRRAPGTPLWTWKPTPAPGTDAQGRNRIPPEARRGLPRFINPPRVVGSVLGRGPVPRRQTSVPSSLLGGGY